MLVLLLCEGLESCLINYIRSSFGEVAKSWVNVERGKLFCVPSGAKLLCVYGGQNSFMLLCGFMAPMLLTFKKLVVTPNNLFNGLT